MLVPQELRSKAYYDITTSAHSLTLSLLLNVPKLFQKQDLQVAVGVWQVREVCPPVLSLLTATKSLLHIVSYILYTCHIFSWHAPFSFVVSLGTNSSTPEIALIILTYQI